MQTYKNEKLEGRKNEESILHVSLNLYKNQEKKASGKPINMNIESIGKQSREYSNNTEELEKKIGNSIEIDSPKIIEENAHQKNTYEKHEKHGESHHIYLNRIDDSILFGGDEGCKQEMSYNSVFDQRLQRKIQDSKKAHFTSRPKEIYEKRMAVNGGLVITEKGCYEYKKLHTLDIDSNIAQLFRIKYVLPDNGGIDLSKSEKEKRFKLP
ncbi:hypothetical protein BTJ40_04935 [Microbulbifer sp. A4B17]|uniref:hypothetical protein n=1 Tax=Microbulbifer sp. A4B17 TaxID=359370 RepID=UPI000D52E543|nr:hypothetical protein [Microbulbifer sp. A4B17]AWF80206.1 hypothetical protein BTJ40_04935 [Microbulbifer sp. A4B17]